MQPDAATSRPRMPEVQRVQKCLSPVRKRGLARGGLEQRNWGVGRKACKITKEYLDRGRGG